MTEKYDSKQVFNYWNQQALEWATSSSASWTDKMVIEKEIQQILTYLQDGDDVLDIGCANGYSSIQFASRRRINILGVDYAPEMIKQALLQLDLAKDGLLGKAEFQSGDITNLKQTDNSYDKVIVIRVLINLENWAQQVKGLKEAARVLKPGGTLLLSEATLQGWNKLNRFRQEWGLDNIPMPPFNQYIDQEQVIEAAQPDLKIVEVVNFASTYYVATRVLKPLLIKAIGAEIDVADPLMEWNRWFARLPSWGDYGTQKLFVFKKN